METVDSMEGQYESPFDSQGCIRTTNSGMNEGSDVTNVTKGRGAVEWVKTIKLAPRPSDCFSNGLGTPEVSPTFLKRGLSPEKMT